MSDPQTSSDAGEAVAVLDIETLITRPVMTIDGARYEILHPDEVSVIEQARFGRAGRRIDQLAQSDDALDETRLDELVKETARKIAVGVPDDVWAKLTGTHHWAIVDVFTALSLRSKMTVAGAMVRSTGDIDAMFRPVAAQTGEKSSPASSASTEAARKSGWRKFLREWSGLL